MEAFRATLEELEEADLMLHVADASHPECLQQIQAVEGILAELGLQETPVLLLLNKVDALAPEQREAMQEAFPDALFISAATKEGLEALSARIVQRIDWSSNVSEPAPPIPLEENHDESFPS